MGGTPTTRLQVSGYRFLIRRMEHALVRGDTRMLDDPLRAQSFSLVAGCVLAAIAVAACAILAFIRPHGAIGDAAIVLSRDTGALYVRIDDTLHPVLNLASARLIAGTPATPHLVSEAAISAARRGPLVGIPGAPNAIGQPLASDESAWTVCDDAASTTVIIGGFDTQAFDEDRAVLVTPMAASQAMTYLLYDGRRARIDLRNAAAVRALRLDSLEPQPVSQALLDALPEAPPVTAPQIPQAGAAGPPALGGLAVGTVVRMTRVDTVEYFVVLAQGVQRIGEVAADLIRFSVPQPDRGVPTVAADVIAAVPMLDTLPVTTFPQRANIADHAVVCARWTSEKTTTLVGTSRPSASRVIALAQADGDGPHVDAVAMPPGRSAYVRTTGITGGTPGSRFLVDDWGVVYGVHDDETAKHLGLSGSPVPAPWPVVAHLPRGPQLRKESASVVRDAFAPP